MDSMTAPLGKPPRPASAPVVSRLFPHVDALASMPACSPLEMPTQSFARYDKPRAHKGRLRRSDWRAQLARLAVFGGALALTVYGTHEMHGVVSVGGVTSLEWGLLILFVINFSWISLALTNAILGLLAILLNRSSPRTADLSRRTAVVMPAYNEDPARIFGALAAIIEDIAQGPHAAQAGSLDWFVLSDTTDPDIWMAEERVFVELRRRLDGAA